MIVIESRNALHLFPSGKFPEGFKLSRGRNEFAQVPHWLRAKLQNFIDAGLMTYEEVLPPAGEKAAQDTEPSPPPPDAEDADAPAEARRKRR